MCMWASLRVQLQGCPSSAVFAASHALDAGAQGERREREVTALSHRATCLSSLTSGPRRLFLVFLSPPSCGRLASVGWKKKSKRGRERERERTVVISVGFHAGLVWQEENLGAVFTQSNHHLLLFSFPFSLVAPFGQYRTAKPSLDEPPRWNPEMELLLICLSLWILQCNSAKADSIIHIGKLQTEQKHAQLEVDRCKRKACGNNAQPAHTAFNRGFWREGGINSLFSSHPAFKLDFYSEASLKVRVL